MSKTRLTKNQLGALQMDLNGQKVPNWMIIWGSQDRLWWNRFETQWAIRMLQEGKIVAEEFEQFVESESEAA